MTLKEILESKGLENAILAVRTHKDQRKLSLFAADCAERVLHIFEEKHPDDKRPRKAIEAARQFARGEIDKRALTHAARAARAAGSESAAYTAAAAAAAGAAAAYWPTRYAAAAATVAAANAAGSESAAYAARAAARYTTEDGLEAETRAQEKLFIKYFC